MAQAKQLREELLARWQQPTAEASQAA
jgi:hypothetical protein